ncbi:gamma-aminobutyric acid type B receptor subunit 2-like isoform X3 [Dysidea avara]|uniref:gamma-aminobutyric acid type B receptor subunit 2-like isoform X3 n=1 Tax=Dysidea avara TaxID=196820 RepID=UPI0033256F3F
MFDAVWAVALALNNTNADLLNFTYDGDSSATISLIIYQNLVNINFFGLSGNVSFRDNGDRPGKVRVLQYRPSNGNLTKVQFGTVKNGSLVFDDNESVTTVFTVLQEMKDIYLFAIVGVLVLIDIVILIPPTAVSSAILRREQQEVEGEDADDLPGIIGVCRSDNSLPWIAVLLAYKGLVLLAGLFLAFETRKVKIRSLNESRFVAMSVYGAVTASIALTPIGFLLNDFPNIQYGIMGIMLLFVTTLILGLVFVSKMYKVYRDPEGADYLEQRHSNVSSTTKTAVRFSEEDYKKRIEDLNFEIKGLTKELEMLASH